MCGDPMRGAYAVPLALAVRFWTGVPKRYSSQAAGRLVSSVIAEAASESGGQASGVTSHGNVGECVDALQHEVARLTDHLRQRRPSVPVASQRATDPRPTSARLTPAAQPRQDLQLPSERRAGPRGRCERLRAFAAATALRAWRLSLDSTRAAYAPMVVCKAVLKSPR